MKRSVLLLLLFGVMAFSLGAWVQPRVVRSGARHDSDNVFTVLLGEGRRMFANHFAVKADVYLHSGFYPSIFDQAAAAEAQEKEAEVGHVHTAECQHDHEEEATHDTAEQEIPEFHQCDTTFMGDSRDWIEKLGRHFRVTTHTHLEGGKEREILPWLKISAGLDPQRIETYTVGAYWLRTSQHRPEQAEEFLRQGLKANPHSHEIIFELGRLFYEDRHDVARARNLWESAFRLWNKHERGKKQPDNLGYLEITVRLGKLEQEAGNFPKAIEWLTLARERSPNPDALQHQIDAIRAQAAGT